MVKKANEDPIRPHGFGKRMISFMVRFILFDPMHANHNHGNYNMCSTLMLTINFVNFFNLLFPDRPHDSKHHETPTQKWGIKKDSAEYHRIMFIKDMVNIVLCEIAGERDLKIVHDKTRKTMLSKKDNITASAFPWRYDGDAF